MLAAITRQCEDYERCESIELDDKIRDLIAGTPEATSRHRSVHSSKVRSMAGLNATGSYMEHAECAPSRTKDSTNSLEQKIRHLEKQRQELLEVNQQWDQQFRNMRGLYERKVLELKMKLAATEDIHTIEKEQKQSMTEGNRQLEERESLREELRALKKENLLLKESNAIANRKKEHYACEIKRLNKVALQDALTIGSASLSEGSRKCTGRCSHAEMKTKVESHKRQPDYQWNALNQTPPHVQHKAHGFSSERKFNQ
ncbi:TNFAIP3-interacting protein 3 [Lemmus lemmus]